MSTKDYMYEKNYEEHEGGVVAYPNNHIDNNAQQIAAIVQVRILPPQLFRCFVRNIIIVIN